MEEVLNTGGPAVDVEATAVTAAGLQALGRPEVVEAGVAAEVMYHVPTADLMKDLGTISSDTECYYLCISLRLQFSKIK